MEPENLQQESSSLGEFTAQTLNRDLCFLCGSRLDASNRTREHVFPQWLLRRHDLWHARLTLLNGETIPYRQLTIACCRQCNTGELSQLEEEISTAFAEGPGAVRALPEERLFLWLAKFYYGLLFRSLTLLLDRRSPENGPIVTADMLREFSLHHLLMRRLLGRVEWSDFPGSLFVFDALDCDDPKHTFDYLDAMDAPFVCIRSGPTFVVGFLQDFGAVKQLGLLGEPRVQAATAVKLHPMQCAELMAFFVSILKLRRRPPRVLLARLPNETYQLNLLPQGGLSGTSPFDPWDADFYYRVLEGLFSTRFGINLDVTPDHRPTLLLSSRGSPIQAPAADWHPPIWDDPDLLDSTA